VRMGLIQPSIGIRYDDHTMLLRANASEPRRPFIPPNYVEPGIELSYHPISWFQMEAGVFSSSYLADSVSGAVAAVTWLGRLMFLPQILGWGIHSWMGVSGYGSGEFLMMNGFLGIGFKGKASLTFDAAETTWDKTSKNLSLAANAAFTPWQWLSFYARVENASALVADKRYHTDQYVLGTTFVPLPFLEIRPEYRYLRTDEYKLAQYTLQVYGFF